MAQIEVVALDMCQSYIALLREVLPRADMKLVFDRYHVVAHMTKAVDQVRRQADQRV